MLKHIYIIIILINLFGCHNSIAQIKLENPELGFPFYRNFSHKDYIAHTQNFDITQDLRGVMYFGNFSGVLEYDGQNWRTITTKENSKVSALATDSKGTVYVGAYGEFGYLKPDSHTGKLDFYSLSDSIGQKDFLEVLEIYTINEIVYFVCNNKIFRYKDNQLEILWETPKENNALSAFYIDNKFFIFLKSNDLLIVSENHEIQVKIASDIGYISQIKTILPYKNNSYMVGSGNKGLFVLQDNKLSQIDTEINDYLYENTLNCGIQLSNSNYVLGTQRAGILITDKNLNPIKIISKDIGLINETVNTLFEDSDNNLWLGLDYGISKLDISLPITYFNETTSLYGEITGIVRHKGVLYFFGNQGIFYLNRYGEFISIEDINFACWDLISISGFLLAATSQGVYSIDDFRPNRICNGFSFSLLPSEKNPNVIYVGQIDRLGRLVKVNNRWSNFEFIASFENEIQNMAEDSEGFIWFELPSKTVKRYNYKKNEIETFDTTQGLPQMVMYQVNKTLKDVLFATSAGVYKFNHENNRFIKIKLHANNNNNEVFSKIYQDDKQNYWTIDWNESNINIIGNEKYIDNYNKILSTVDDFIARQIFFDSDGIIWFCGPDGVLRFNSSFKYQKKDFNTLIRRIKIGGDSLLFAGTFCDKSQAIVPNMPQNKVISLDYEYNSISFEFIAPKYDIKSKVEYQLTLHGYDKFESPWSKTTFKEYTNLPAGEYRFSVKSRNHIGDTGKRADITFVVETPFNQSITAYILYLTLVIALIYLIIRWRIRYIENEKRNLERIIQEATEEIRVQKEEIETKSEELTHKNSELEKINMIVQAINAEINFNSLMQLLLNKLKVIKGLNLAAILFYNSTKKVYQIRAHSGYEYENDKDITFNLEETRLRYIENSTEVSEDIYLNTNPPKKATTGKNGLLERSKSVLTIIINTNERTEGYILIGNTSRANAFDQRDFDLAANLKEHLISAFIKTGILENLQETNEILVEQKKSITDSIVYARRIQKAILPSEKILAKNIKEHFILFKPRDIVSGDFFWMKHIDNLIIIVAADCTGHGVPGAFMSMLGVAFLNEIVSRMHITKANLILNELRKQVKEALGQTGKDNEAKDGMDIALCILNKQNKTIEFAGAHNSLLQFTPDNKGNYEMNEIKADRMPIGIHIREKDSFTNHTLNIKTNDVFYMFSDGYVDQFGGEKGFKFKIKNFKKLLHEICALPLNEQKQILNKTIEDWKGDSPQIDDILVMGFKV